MNIFQRSSVYGKFVVQDKYLFGNPTGTVVDKGDSYFYGNINVKGDVKIDGTLISNLTGVQGPIGPQGAQGLQGPAGFASNTGATGYTV